MEVLTAVTAFWIVSITMVFVNKHLLDTSATKFNVLLFVSWFQCASAVFLCFAMSHAGRYFQRPAFVSLDVREMRAVGMLSFVLLFMIVTNNLCLKNVTVAFYYVSRSLSTLFTVLLSYFMLGRVSGWRSMICCGAIVVGKWIALISHTYLMQELKRAAQTVSSAASRRLVEKEPTISHS